MFRASLLIALILACASSRAQVPVEIIRNHTLDPPEFGMLEEFKYDGDVLLRITPDSIFRDGFGFRPEDNNASAATAQGNEP